MDATPKPSGILRSRLLVRSFTCGAVATLVVLLISWMGLLESLEQWLYDRRVADCQYFSAPPSDRIVHLDIDDAALEAIGHWPWPRGIVAQLLDEVHQAGPKAVCIDVLFSESQSVTYLPRPDGTYQPSNDDIALADKLGQLGNVTLPIACKLRPLPQPGDLMPDITRLLTENLELNVTQIIERLKPVTDQRKFTSGQVQQQVEQQFLLARRNTMFARLQQELRQGNPSVEQLNTRLIPGSDPRISSPLNRLLSEQYEQVKAILAVRRFGMPAPTGFPQALGIDLNLVPILDFSNRIDSVGFADYEIFFRDSRVRSVPLFLEHDGLLYPQMGLRLACRILDADLSAARIQGSKLVIPAKDHPIIIPIWSYQSQTQQRDIPLIADIPWFGTRIWETMYDSRHIESKQHVSINRVWEICKTSEKILHNNRSIDQAIGLLLDTLDSAKADRYATSRPAIEDAPPRKAMARIALTVLKESGILEAFAGIPETELKPDERKQRDLLTAAQNALLRATEENDQLLKQRIDLRTELSTRLANRGALIGWVATGASDKVPTSLHSSCPGAVVHGVIANAVLNGHWWTRAPAWVSFLLTLALGMSVAALDGLLSPLKSTLAAAGLALGYLVFNGVVLFDYFDLIVNAGAPLLAIGATWSSCMVQRLILEGIERIRITISLAVIDNEVQLAKQVQQALIPKYPPKIVGIECHGWTLAATTTGGDCFDLWTLPDGRLGILLADASGHGLAPSMIVSQVRALVRVISEMESHPQGALNRVNARLSQDVETGRFVTCFLGYIDSAGQLHYASAGQGPVLWRVGKETPIKELEPTSMPLGIMPDWMAEDPLPPLQLDESGMLLVMSDGIFEAPNPRDEQFGVERVVELSNDNIEQSPEGLIHIIREKVRAWQAKDIPIDDQTMVVIRRSA